MSDYISKSALIEDVHKIRCQNGISEEVGHNRPLTDIANVYDCINNQPTVDETEIIRKAFERVVERLEEDRLNEYSARAEYISGMNGLSKCYCDVRIETIEKAIKIVKEECGINE